MYKRLNKETLKENVISFFKWVENKFKKKHLKTA